MNFWMQNPINRESAAIAGECLKIVMVLQTLSKDRDCEKLLIHLLLESVLMIFMTSAGSRSQVMSMFSSFNIFFLNLPALIITFCSRRLVIYETRLLSSSHTLLRLLVQLLLSGIFFWQCLLHRDSSFRFFWQCLQNS